MKKATVVLSCVLFALIVLFPIMSFVCACFGYIFELISIPAFSIIIAILSFCTVVLSFIAKDAVTNKTVCVLSAVIPLLSLINAVFYIVLCSTVWVIASTFVTAVCCFLLAAKCGKPLVLKTIALAVSVLMVFPIGYFGFVAWIFGNIAQDTIVQTVESPSGKYYAEVTDNDQGALGGNTLVDVYEHSGINALIFKIKKMPQHVYCGHWGEFENMQIYWKDDGCLIINSVEYEIK